VDQILNRGGLETYQKLRDQGKIRFSSFTVEGPSGGVSRLIAAGAFDVMQVRYNFMYQHTCDFVNEEGIIREARKQGMGIVTMRSLTSGTFQKVMRQAFPQLEDVDLDSFLLNFNLSNPLLDVVLVGMRRIQEVEKNNAISDNTAMRLDLIALHMRTVREGKGENRRKTSNFTSRRP